MVATHAGRRDTNANAEEIPPGFKGVSISKRETCTLSRIGYADPRKKLSLAFHAFRESSERKKQR
jgi:hypothetical protein